MSYHGDTLREIQRDILSLLPDDIAQNSSQSSGYQGSQNSRYGHEEQTSRLADQVCYVGRIDNYSVVFYGHSADPLTVKWYFQIIL